MLKSEEHTLEVLASDLNEERCRRHAAEKGKREAERRADMLEKKVDALQTQLAAKIDEISSLMQQLVQFMMGNGSVSLSESVKESVIAGVRAEFERREADLRQSYELQIAALRNEINSLKNKDGQNPSSGSPASQDDVSLETRLKSAEQQNANLAVTAYGQHTESGKFHHGNQQVEDADTLDLNGEDVPDERVVEIACQLKGRRDRSGIKKPRREQPLAESSKGSDDEIFLVPDNLPADAEHIGDDVTIRYCFVEGHIRTLRIVQRKYKDAANNYYQVKLPAKYHNCMGRTQVTESLIAHILVMHFEYNMTIGDIEAWLKGKGLNFSHSTIVGWIRLGANILAPLDDPLQHEITSSGNLHSDESTLKCQDKRLPNKKEKEGDVEQDEHYFKRWIFCHHAPGPRLTQFVFHKRGRRTQEAIKEYLKDVTEKTYLHSDGAALYKCYDVCEIIVRVSCLVHMRRPLYKLKDVYEEALRLSGMIDQIFHLDKKLKERNMNPEAISHERILQIGPLLHDLYSSLESLAAKLENEDEPELLKAVKYALKEFPCILHCLEDGRLDLSNNVCERQIRELAKYRNNSFFVGSVESAERFARLMSVFANIRNHKLNPIAYLCDVFRRIKHTAKEELVNLLAHKWKPTTVAAY